MLKSFLKCASGATLVEYGVALVMAIVIGGGGLATLAGETSENMADVAPTMNTR